jgi:hypothetical protein
MGQTRDKKGPRPKASAARAEVARFPFAETFVTIIGFNVGPVVRARRVARAGADAADEGSPPTTSRGVYKL